MKKVLMISIIMVLLFTSVAYGAQPYFKLHLDIPKSIFLNETLQAKISVTDHVYGKDNPTSAIDFSIIFNPEHFEFLGFTTKDGAYASVQQAVYEDVYQDQRILIGMLGNINAITEDSDLLTLNFKAKAVTYKSPLSLHNAKAATSTGEIFYPEISFGEVTIADLYDVNMDGYINLADLAIVSYNVGNDAEEHYYADLNNDGVIDTDDIDILMNYILREQGDRFPVPKIEPQRSRKS